MFSWKTRGKKRKLPSYPSQRLRSPVTVSSSSEKATSALTGAHLLLRRVELRGREFLSPGLVGYNALLHLLIVSSDPEDLPRSYNTVVKSVHYVENVPAAKTHLAFLRLFVVEVGPIHFIKLYFVSYDRSPGINTINFKNFKNFKTLTHVIDYRCL